MILTRRIKFLYNNILYSEHLDRKENDKTSIKQNVWKWEDEEDKEKDAKPVSSERVMGRKRNGGLATHGGFNDSR